jgi:hypothetical protein
VLCLLSLSGRVEIRAWKRFYVSVLYEVVSSDVGTDRLDETNLACTVSLMSSVP